MDVTPFEFRTRDIDSAVRFCYFCIEEAKKAQEEIKHSFDYNRAIRLFRTLGRKIMGYNYIRQSMDINKQEEQLVKDLQAISKRCTEALAVIKRNKGAQPELVEAILKDIIILEANIGKILKKYEKKVARGEGIYAGIDGGGTKTVAIISRAGGKVLGIGRGGPCDPGRVGAIRSFDSIVVALKQACEKAGINFKTAKFERIGAGIVIRSKEIHRRVEELMTEYTYRFMPKHVKDAIFLPDHVVSWYAATKGRPGVILIGGTGHIAYGHNPLTKKEAVCFTYEASKNLNTIENVHLSGRFLAYHGARAIKTNPKSILARITKKAFDKGKLFRLYKEGGRTFEEILIDINHFFEVGFRIGPNISHNVVLAQAHGMAVNDIPELGEYVLIAAREGDKAALKIILDGAKTMAAYISRIATDIGLHNKRFIVGLTGSVILNEIVRVRLENQIRLFEPAITPEDIVISEEPAQITALKIAIENKRFY
ncbi:hypothetical protein KY361_01470 [Candidatus Woesearchaeota archaeon]|nr:hypothetical protein [Candidatus Woesearchaeota archaeon]